MKKALLLVAGCLFGLLLAELAARISGVGREFYERDTVVGYWLRPNFSRVLIEFEAEEPSITATSNNLGLRRDGDIPWDKPAGTRRVLVLGDSQTEGIVANKDTFAAQLEQMLAADGAVGVEVLNAGVSGYSPLLEYLWLRERGRRLQPDIVVLALYTGNDIGELTARQVDFGGFGPRITIPTLARDGDDWQVLRPGAPSLAAEVDAWLEANLRTYALVRKKVGYQGEQIEVLGRAVGRCLGCLQALWLPWLAQERPAAYHEATLQLRQVLKRFKALAEEIGARPVVVVLPTKLEVEQDSVRQEVLDVQGILGLQTDPWVFSQTVRQEIVAASAAERLEVHDILPVLQHRHEELGRSLYWSQDWHLNPEGNRVVAEALKPEVAALLPPSR